MSDAILARVILIASEVSGKAPAKLSSKSAVDQDMNISGGDVEDFAAALEKEFAAQVWHWPWDRFALLDEGISLLFPFILVGQLISWPFRGSFEYPSPYERLELGHIAAVIEKGEWFEP